MTEPTAAPASATPAFVTELVARARATDGQPPFSDQSLVDLRTGARELVSIGEDAVALVSATEAEFVVAPDARGRGLGAALLEELLSRSPAELFIWAHGDHPAARSLAASHGLEAARELLQLRAPLAPLAADASPVATPAGTTLATFRVGTDEEAWLDLNSRAFSFHPEQGSVSRVDFDELIGEDWFRAEDFLLLWQGESLVGYCWLKVDDGLGEFYVVGVDPDRQGSGFGRVLTEAGLHRLRAQGIRTAHLYVEATSTAAVRLYRSLGFVDFSIDIQYRAPVR